MATFTKYSVNKNGLDQIAQFLRTYHKNGALLSEVKDTLHAYARKVEFSLSENDRADFEISASNSINGWTELCRITQDGLDSTEIEIDE